MKERLKKFPVPVLPTFVGTLTLGNVYGGMGYTWFRVLIMICATVIVLAYIFKIILCSSTCMEEYKQTQELRNALAKQRGSDVII